MAKNSKRVQDLVAFLAVLVTGAALVLRGVAPESLATIAVAVSGIYAAWRGNGGPPQPPAGGGGGQTAGGKTVAA
ncbi:hypothetical protein ACF07V_03880 [Streptomyces sp. NPDC015661]|uniref:hypothetical protein n=1 Tax=Streptomyces sp. NPDC015661 TaxID=3364961 RepID=UPI0036F7DA49